jgi:hypothetical protein
MKLTIWQKIQLYKLATNPAMIDKLKSRKLWATVATTVIVLVGNHVGVPNDILTLVTGLVASYIIGQSVVDATAKK